MKISETIANRSSIERMSGRDDRKAAGSANADFRGQLRQLEYENHEKKLSELAGKIMELGDKLGKKVDIREFKLYKNLLSEFLEEAVGSSLDFSKESFLDRRGRYRVYAVVKKINTEIEQLAKDVLDSEKDNIKILKRLDDIRGLILDILM